MTERRAEIVGAGFAGLTAACALAQRGWNVRVHERADRLRTTGAGIYIYENGLRVLEAVGAYAAATHGAPFAHTREVRDDRNRVISVHRWQGSRVFFHDTEFGVNWDGLAYCESTNNPKAVNNPAGFLSTYGLFQFDLPTWQSVGGSGNPGDASPEEQLQRAKVLYKQRGLEPWLCGYAASGPPAG